MIHFTGHRVYEVPSLRPEAPKPKPPLDPHFRRYGWQGVGIASVGLVLLVFAIAVAGCSGELGTPPASESSPVEFHPVDCMPRAVVEAVLGEPIGPERSTEVPVENACGIASEWPDLETGEGGGPYPVTVPYAWGTVDYLEGVAVAWAEGGV